MLETQCHKQLPFGDGKHTTHKHGDLWMVTLASGAHRMYIC